MALAPMTSEQPSAAVNIMSKVEHGMDFTAKALTVGHALYRAGRFIAPFARAAFL